MVAEARNFGEAQGVRGFRLPGHQAHVLAVDYLLVKEGLKLLQGVYGITL